MNSNVYSQDLSYWISGLVIYKPSKELPKFQKSNLNGVVKRYLGGNYDVDALLCVFSNII
jgi:hypothetical protein